MKVCMRVSDVVGVIVVVVGTRTQTSSSHLYPGEQGLYSSHGFGLGVVDGVSGIVGGATHMSP
ncbi:unnamed protein product [Meloidogyne enterolobii]|uniref:Uncharacterized protein n=1 Tax=Meloidogyne enterolobii TaxID=390850 RepID=A0ACB0ZFT2_MELEN